MRSHNPEVVGSSPASATRKEKVIPTGMAFFFSLFVWSRTRTHRSGTVRWTVPATSSKTGGYLYFRLWRKCISSPASATRKEKVIPTGMAFFFSLFVWSRTRTHRSGTVRWTVPATGSKTGGYLYFRLWRKCISSPASATRKEKVIPTGMAFLFEAARNSDLQGGFALTYGACGANMNP